MHSFTLADLAASLAAACIFPLFLVAPGYAAGWALDLFEFRRRTAPFRLALAVALSVAFFPLAAYLAARAGGMGAVWAVCAAAWIYCAWAIARFGPGAWKDPRTVRILVVAASVWAAIALFSLCDLQIASRLYYSTIAFDFSVRTEFIHAISSTGIPPSTPFFYTGATAPLRYHYFWLIPCSLVDLAGGRFVSARQAWIGGVLWCGFGLLAMLALFLRLTLARGGDQFAVRVRTGAMLLGITGLDLLPTALLWFFYAHGRMDTIPPSLEWWNDQVDSFLWTALWEAHHLAGLIACLTAFLLLLEAPRRSGRGRWTHAALGGAAMACGFGESIYVTLVFAAFVAIWTASNGLRKHSAEALTGLAAGAICLGLAAPYLASVAHGAQGAGAGALPFRFQIRSFWIVDHLLTAMGRDQPWRVAMVNAALLPLNYLLELGFFFLSGVVWLSRRRRRGLPLTREETAVALMIGVSMVICTFFRSTLIDNNDLGWRGFLPAQFGLLLWGIDVLSDRKSRAKLVMAAMLALGVAGTVYDLALLRSYPVLADAGALPELSWMSPDRRLGERNYALREAYEWAARKLPGAVLQFDPHVAYQNTPAFLYSERQIAAADPQCLAGFGGDARNCAVLLAAVTRLYPDRGAPAPASLLPACSSTPATLLAVNDTDEVWRDGNSWVWRERPVFANRYVRLFECPQGR